MQVYDPSSTHENSLALEGASTKAARGEDAKGNTKKAKERKSGEKKVGPNQATAEGSHWKVAGSTKTDVIFRKGVIHDSRVQLQLGPSSRWFGQSNEHHQDPPSNEMSDSGENSREETPSEEDDRDQNLNPLWAMCTDEGIRHDNELHPTPLTLLFFHEFYNMEL